MKYYIPTSNLNLDIILQAESISPSSFYAQRETGYKTIEVIQELRASNKIVLFQNPVYFTINDPNRYNFPMLIEIEDKEQFSNNCLNNIGNGVYTYDHTLYLTPTNCRIFFFSENAYKLTTINTRSNKSIKYYEKYQIFPTAAALHLEPMPQLHFEKNLSVRSKETQNDKKKGLLYAYLLGHDLSITPELAHQSKLTQEIYDIIAGIMTNLSMSEKFKEKLGILLEDYKSVDIIEKENRLIFNKNFDLDLGRFKFLKHCLIDLLTKWGIWDYVYRQRSIKWNCKTLPLISELVSLEQYRTLRKEIEQRTYLRIAEYKKTKPKPTLTSIHFSEKQVAIDEVPILSIAVNYIINNRLIPEQLSAHRTEICLGMINAIKEYYLKERGENSWNDGPRTYVNNLYNHIQNIGTPFALNTIESTELIAIAAFLLRGQSIENYLAYLKMNEITDYSCALILWGALCGYMDMNKDVLLEILTIDNYENVYSHLLGIKMFKATWETTIVQQPSEQSNANEINTANYLSIINYLLKSTDIVHKALNAKLIKEEPLHLQIDKILNSKPCKKCKVQCDKARKALELVDNHGNKEYFQSLMNELETSDAIKQQIANKFNIYLPNHKQKRNKIKISRSNNNTPSIFADEKAVYTDFSKVLLFTYDKEAWQKFEDLIPDNTRKDLYNDFKWFIEQMRLEPKHRPKYYQNIDEKNNAIVINRFCHLKEKPDKFGRSLAPYFTQNLRIKIKERLISIYCND